jgi:hypothetical protein
MTFGVGMIASDDGMKTFEVEMDTFKNGMTTYGVWVMTFDVGIGTFDDCVTWMDVKLRCRNGYDVMQKKGCFVLAGWRL